MKSFLASFVGTLLALCAFCVLAVVFIFGGLMLLATAGQKAVVAIPDRAYLVVNLDGLNLTDAPPLIDEGGLSMLLNGDAPRSLALRTAIEGLQGAAKDARIRGVLVTGSFAPEGYGTGFAALEEFRDALADVKAAGKPVRAYFDSVGTAELYVSSVASDIMLNPFGLVLMPGLASEPMFYGAAFEKWGVGVQVTRSGKYKGAVEPFIRENLSAENREQLDVLLTDLWKVLRDDIAEARGMSAETLQRLVDAEGLISPESAKTAGLVSTLGYRDEMLEALRSETGAEAGEPFTQVAFVDYLRVTAPAMHLQAKPESVVAVVYAEGEIVDGESRGVGEVGGATYARELRALRMDESVSAVVLRVNSPGGSASASEEILRELRLLVKEKPVVISMGSYAASGGYWISTYGNRIFTEASTVTGSIGVFGVQFDVEQLARSLGLTWDRVQTSEKAGMLTVARPKTATELAVFQRLVDHTYDEFLVRVAEGRGLDKAVVHDMAQGRVWSGSQAVKLGLADEIGGLNDAIRHAAKLAEIVGEPTIQEFPRTVTLPEALAEVMKGTTPQETLFGRVQSTPRGPLGKVLTQTREQVGILERMNDPRGVYVRLPLDLRVR